MGTLILILILGVNILILGSVRLIWKHLKEKIK
jgi:hypothetical protein